MKKKNILDKEISNSDGFDEINNELKHLENLVEKMKKNSVSSSKEPDADSIRNDSIAIIGLSGRFPDAANADELWNNLCNGKCSIHSIRREGFDTEAYCSTDATKKNTCLNDRAGLIDNIRRFDAQFFMLSPHEVVRMDPQQRLLLEEMYKAIEDSGYSEEEMSNKRVGVFVGSRGTDYKELALLNHDMDSHIMLGNELSIQSARLSYLLNLKGPCLSIDTACSSSLVALHEACESLKRHETNIAIAAGAYLITSPQYLSLLSVSNVLSPDGMCKAFDDAANGIVMGEGVGAVMLKRLEDAIKDHDSIYCVVKGSLINSDGKTSGIVAGITAPSAEAQKELLVDVYSKAQINPETIGYVEAHGTGTKLGDPIEFKGLTQAFSQFTDKTGYCAIGSLKSNIGHTATAAGITSIIKMAKAFEKGMLPPQIGTNKVNRYIDFEKSPFLLNYKLRSWDRIDDNPRRAGISSFGFSGTNCHVILEEAPIKAREEMVTREYLIFPFSAKNKIALKQKIVDFRDWLERNTQVSLDDISYTLCVGRSHFKERYAIVAQSREDLASKLDAVIAKKNDFQKVTETKVSIEELISDDDYVCTKENIEKLFLAYVGGEKVDFSYIFRGSCYNRVHMPTYPFGGDDYWASKDTGYLGMPLRESLSEKLEENNVVITEADQASETMDDFSDANEYVEKLVIKTFSKFTGFEEDNIEFDIPFVQMGVDSIVLVNVVQRINKALGINVRSTELYKYTNIQLLLDFIFREFCDEITTAFEKNKSVAIVKSCDKDKKSRVDSSIQSKQQENSTCDIAVVGMSGVFPDASNIDDFYSNLEEGKRSVRKFIRWDDVERWGGIVDDVNMFDSLFFNISPAEAEKMDPQQRIFLQEVWKALEDAGCSQRHMENAKCGVFVGAGTSDYEMVLNDYGCFSDKHMLTGVSNSLIAARISYLLNMRGMAAAVDTACSSSLMAVHLACNSLCSNESSIAIAGGVNIMSTPRLYDIAKEMNVISESGQCWTFDERADGFIPGEAVCAVVMKRLDDAIKDGNHIYGIIAGSMTNQDGRSNGITAPNGEAQTELEIELYEKCGIDARDISYIEAHGTGTKLGDPIEVMALKEAFEKYTKDKNFCAIGSVKTNVGHAQAASGIVSLVKVMKCLDKKKLVPSVNFANANVLCEFEDGPFYVNTEIKEWNTENDKARIAAISSFGLSGTNVHVVVKDYTGESVSRDSKNKEVLIALSAKTENALIRRIEDLKNYVANNSSVSLEEVSYTLLNGRSHFKYRVAFAVTDAMDLKKKLENMLEDARCGHLDVAKVSKKFKLVAVESAEITNICQELKGICGEQRIKSLSQLAGWYKKGYVLDELYQNGEHNFDSIPTYPFEKIKILCEGVKSEKKIVEEEETIEKDVRFLLEQYISQHIYDDMKIAKESIDMDASLLDYGYESMSLKELTSNLDELFGIEVPPTVFYTLESINDFVDYLLSDFGTVISAYYGACEIEKKVSDSIAAQKESSEIVLDKKVAIIGVKCLLPGANGKDEFWENMINNRSSITPIPEGRKELYEATKAKGYFGGFISDVDKFDAKFFRISPLEAEQMDPQQRKMIEVVYHAIEDSGYNVLDMAGSNTGVFVSVENSDYAALAEERGIHGAGCAVGMTRCMVANRVSFLFDFHGPSEVVDTACSGSLIALNRAYESLVGGYCDTAIVGGAKILLTARDFDIVAGMNVMSPDGVMRTFDKSANGYTRSEGVVALILKPYNKALEDGDFIYGNIIASGENHGGRSRSSAAPNQLAQEALIYDTVKKSGVAPSTITYIESHGTATELGDPIEVGAVSNAFARLDSEVGNTSEYNVKKRGIGSVKPNIGHLETVSGIAGVLKVLLAMQNKKLPATKNFVELNPYINLENVSLEIVAENKEWKQMEDSEGNKIPLRAGVNAFGVGGSNVHVILESYENDVVKSKEDTYLFCLSANSEEALKEYVEENINYWKDRKGAVLIDPEKVLCDILAVIEHFCGQEVSPLVSLASSGFDDITTELLRDAINFEFEIEFDESQCNENMTPYAVAIKVIDVIYPENEESVNEEDFGNFIYTMLQGRASLPYRLAVEVKNPQEMCSILQRYLNGENSVELGVVRKENAKEEEVSESELIRLWENKRYLEVAKMWLLGVRVNWKKIVPSTYKRVPALLYPFEKKSFWLPEEISPIPKRNANSNISHVIGIHPVLDANMSTLRSSVFIKTISCEDFYVKDHVINGEEILPAVVYMEMARAAGEIALEEKIDTIKDLYLLKPIKISDKKQIFIELVSKTDRITDFEIYSMENGTKDVHVTGKVGVTGTEKCSFISNNYVRGEEIKINNLYNFYRESGIEYGNSFQTIVSAERNRETNSAKALVQYEGNTEKWGLHPSLMDGALQTPGILLDFSQRKGYMPFYVSEMHIWRELPKQVYVYVNRKDTKGAILFDIEITDMNGNIVAQIFDINAREIPLTSVRRVEPQKNNIGENDVSEMSDTELMFFLNSIEEGNR